ncbi:uncharacterized protein LOC144074356 [Stigmatopora argus]
MLDKTIKDFNINFNALNANNTFSSGDLLTGQISFDLSKATKIRSIKMCLTGKVDVHWTSGSKKNKRHYYAKIDFFNLKSMILHEGAVGVPANFPPGRHVYPFTCQIPQGDFPSSFRGPHGQIAYNLTVGIDRPWRMSKEFVTELNLVHRIDGNQPELMSPLSGSNSMNVCSLSCVSGLITMKGSVEKKGFMCGETITIICDFTNGSSRTVIPKAKLKQKQLYFTREGVQRRLIVKNLVSVTGLPLSAHTSDFQSDLMLTIPAESSLTISNCSLLRVEYEIELTLCPRASPNLTVLFPIILCDIHSIPHANMGGGKYALNPGCRLACPFRKVCPAIINPTTKGLFPSFFVFIMPSTVKSLKVTYSDVSEKGTFTSGDAVNGQVILEVAKECKVESFYVKFKGKAEVLWTERHGQTTVTYHSKNKYFSIKHYFIQGGSTGKDLLFPGYHEFPFNFQFPLQEMPSSFTGSVGKVVYLLETKLSRSMRLSTKDTAKIPFVTKLVPNMSEDLMIPQHDSKNKKMHMFNSGTIAMDVKIEKSGFFPGEGLKILAYIQNNSSRQIKPKFCIYRKHSFFARGKRRLDTKDLLKEVGDSIPPSAGVTVNRVITIPPDMEPSILNCEILKVEYRLRVYLDVKYSSDPEIKFPITILPAFQASAALAANMPLTSTGFEFTSHGYQNPPPVDAFSPQQPFDPPPPYEGHGMYPSLMDSVSK